MSAHKSKSKRRWLQFSLRTLLAAVLVVAVLMAVWRVHAQKQLYVLALVQRLGGDVTYSYQRKGLSSPPGPEWLRKLMGDEYFLTVDGVAIGSQYLTDDDLTVFQDLTRLRVLRLSNGQLTDRGLEKLTNLSNLTDLDLNFTLISDAGMPHLSRLTNLKELSLKSTNVTDAGLPYLLDMRKLEKLRLGHYNLKGRDADEQPVSNITDDGLSCLAGLRNLKMLVLLNTKATPEGLQRLKDAIPNLTIQAGAGYMPESRGSRFIKEERRWVKETPDH